jgi:hypothetical protein
VVLLKTGNNDSKSLAEYLINAKTKIEEMESNEYGLLEIYGSLKLVKK